MSEKFTLTLDASQIYEFQMCPLKWWYHYKENLRLIGLAVDALDKGTLIHNLLDLYYTLRYQEPKIPELIHAQKAIELFKASQITESYFPQDKELEEFLCLRFILYIQNYLYTDFNLMIGPKPVELGFSKLLFENDEVRFIVEGRIDLISILQENTFIFIDHKTQSKNTNLYQYKPQFKTYAWATGYNYGLINYFGLQEDKNNLLLKAGNLFKRQLIYFPVWMIQEWEQKMLDIFWEITGLLKSSNPEQLIYQKRNDSYCGGAFDSNPCQFTHICELGNWDMKQALKEFKYKKVDTWTPWELKHKNEK